MFCVITVTLLASFCVSTTTACLGKKHINLNLTYTIVPGLYDNLPSLFPCQWAEGIIPFVFDFYTITSNRMLTRIREGHASIQNQSCLTFDERNPIIMAQSKKDFHYLYYTYTNALEDCCAGTIEPSAGRRIVLLTPSCKESTDIAHVTLHMLGLTHKSKKQEFSQQSLSTVLRPGNCSFLLIPTTIQPNVTEPTTTTASDESKSNDRDSIHEDANWSDLYQQTGDKTFSDTNVSTTPTEINISVM